MEKTFSITNVNLAKLDNLIDQSTKVKETLMLEFSPTFIRSCAVSPQETMAKLTHVLIDDICHKPKEEKVVDVTKIIEDKPIINHDIDTVFNFYLMRGTLLGNVFNIFDKYKPVTLKFNVNKQEDGVMRAEMMTISGLTSTNSSMIEVNIPLTKESMTTESVNDFGAFIQKLTPAEENYNLVITPKIYDEVCTLIKKLNKITLNQLYFDVTITGDKIRFNDTIFNVEYDLETPVDCTEPINFKLSKSDWCKLTGDEPLAIYLSKNLDDPNVIFIGKYKDAVISSLMTKVRGSQITSEEGDDGLESLDLVAYDFEDDLPF